MTTLEFIGMVQLVLTIILTGAFFAMRARIAAGIRSDLIANPAIIGGIVLIGVELVTAIQRYSEGNMLAVWHASLVVITIALVTAFYRVYTKSVKQVKQ